MVSKRPESARESALFCSRSNEERRWRYSRSAPAQKAYPFAESVSTLTDESSAAALNAEWSSETMRSSSAFRFSGRFREIVQTRFVTETSILENVTEEYRDSRKEIQYGPPGE